MHVTVTRDDILWAKQQNRWNCAIVRAIQRQMPEATFVRVDAEKIAYTENGHRYFHPTPQIAIDKVIKPFDEGREVKPIGFNVKPAVQIKQAQRLTPEDNLRLREYRRQRAMHKKAGMTNEEIKRANSTTSRFCEPSDGE